jgi:hypothetical protein
MEETGDVPANARQSLRGQRVERRQLEIVLCLTLATTSDVGALECQFVQDGAARAAVGFVNLRDAPRMNLIAEPQLGFLTIGAEGRAANRNTPGRQALDGCFVVSRTRLHAESGRTQ